MSYFPEDIPFMSEEERKANGIKTAKEIETQKTQLSKEDATFDCISRQVAIDALKICDNNEDGINCHKCPLRDERWNGAWQDNETNCYTKLMRDSAKLLEVPSAQPELIMCKDCKFADGEATTSNGMYWCIVHGTYMRYCSDAKRRTDVDMRGEQT